MRVPYHRQHRDYWCGPAVLQMALDFFGIRVSQARLARHAQTTERNGTRRTALVQVLRSSGLAAEARSDARVPDLRRSLRNGSLVLINFTEPKEESHYALVAAFRGQRIVLADPWHGPRFSMGLAEFRHRWSNPRYRGRGRWMAAVTRRTPDAR